MATVDETARRIAGKVFDMRSRGRRNVEVHLSEAELIAILKVTINLTLDLRPMLDEVAACEKP
jgi:hypothetical protein